MKENPIQTRIRLALGKLPHVLVQRRHVGTYRSMDGKRYITIGAKGEADLSVLVGNQHCPNCDHGIHPKLYAVEVKDDEGGQQSDDQANWQANTWERRGGTYVLARSPDDALCAMGLAPADPDKKEAA